MPELPEVETVRRSLAPKILRHTIEVIDVRLPKIIRGGAEEFSSQLQGKTITELDRRGKLLTLWLDDRKDALLVHLKMTGQLIFRHTNNPNEQVVGGHPWPPFDGDLPNKYSHVIFGFDDGGRLYFNDLRQFGFLQIADANEVSRIHATYGLEPGRPEFTLPNFLQILEKKRGVLKAVLLDQRFISGLGNIYVDEACFWAGILPMRRVESLNETERTRLFDSIVNVIHTAIEQRGTTVHDYVDADGKRGNYSDFLMVYGRAGLLCLRCAEQGKESLVQKVKLSGRGTHFCEKCQF